MNPFDIKNINPQTGLTEPLQTNNPFKNIRGSQFGPVKAGQYGVGEYSRDKNLNFSDVVEQPDELQYKRAGLQSNAELIGKFLGQAATESTLGAIESVGYLLDFEDLFNTDDMASRDFDNVFAKWVRGKKERVNDKFFHIYKSKVAENGTLGQKLGDKTWWASQGDTFGQSMTMMLPAIGIAGLTSGIMKSAGYGAKILKAAKTAEEIAQATNKIGEGINAISGLTAGLTSAKIEAAVEATDAYRTNYQNFLNDPDVIQKSLAQYKPEYDQLQSEYEKLSQTLYNPSNEDYPVKEAGRRQKMSQLEQQMDHIKDITHGSLDHTAREMAGEAASLVYKANAIKAPLEVAQWMVGLKSFEKLKGGLEAVKESKVGTIAEHIFQPASETFEEGWQGFAQVDATHSVKTGEQFLGGEDVGQRIKDYQKTEDAKESEFLGGLMGIVFDYGARYGGKVLKNINKTIKKSTEDPTITKPEYKAIQNNNHKEAFINAYENDGIKGINSLINNIQSASEDILKNEQLSDADKEEVKSGLEKANELNKFIQEKDNFLSNDPRFQNQQLKSAYVKAQLEDKMYQDDVDVMNQYMSERLNNSGLEAQHSKVYENLISIQSLKAAQNELLKEQSLTKEEKDNIKSHVEEKINNIKTENDALVKSIKETNPKFDVKKLAPRDSHEIIKYNRNKIKSEVYREAVTQQRINKFNNLKLEDVQAAISESESENNRSDFAINSDALKKINNTSELRVFESQISKNNPVVYDKLKPVIEAKKAELQVSEDKTKIATIQETNFRKLSDKVNNMQTKQELETAKVQLESDNKKTINDNHKQELFKQIDNKLSTITEEPKIVKAKTKSGNEIIGELSYTKTGKPMIKKEGNKSSTLVDPETIEELSKQSQPEDIEAQKANIEKRRNAEIANPYKMLHDSNIKKGTELFRRATSEEEYFDPNSRFVSLGKIKALKTNSNGNNLQGVLVGDRWLNKGAWYDMYIKNDVDAINAKYDSELSALNTQPNVLTNTIPLTTEEQTITEETPIVDNQSIITPELEDELNDLETRNDGSDRTGLFEVDPRVLLTTKAKESVEYRDKNGNLRFKDKYDSHGDLIKMPLYDAKMASEDVFKENSQVILSVNTEFIKVKNGVEHVVIDGKDKGKLTIENLPINISTVEDFEANKTPYVAIRDLSEGKWTNLESSAKEKTIALREKMFKAYKKNKQSISYSTVTSKDNGWINKTERPKSLSDNLKISGHSIYGDKISFGVSGLSNTIMTANGEAVNMGRIPPGLPYLIIPNANGQEVGTRLTVSPLSEQITPSGEPTGVYNDHVQNVFAILEAYANDDPRFTYQNVYKEVGKYFNLRESAKGLDDKVNPNGEDLNNNVFAAYKDKSGRVVISLPANKGYKQIVIKKTNGGLQYYTTFNGIDQQSSKESLLKEFNNRLDQMYQNIQVVSNSEIYNFKRFEYKDGKLEQVSDNYIDFLSKSGIKTRVIPMIGSDGKPYYVSQPNITIDENIKSDVEFNQTQESPKQSNDNKVVEEQSTELISEIPTVTTNETFSIEDFNNIDFNLDIDNLNEANEPIDGIEFNNTSLSSFSNLNDIQKESGLVQSMLNILLQRLDSKRELNTPTTTKEALGEVKSILINTRDKFNRFTTQNISTSEANTNGVTIGATNNAKIAQNLDFFINNFEQQLNNDGSVKFIGYGNKVLMEYNRLSFNSAYLLDEEALEDVEDKPESFIEGKNYKTDPEKSLSAQIKRTLSDIKKVKPNGKYISNAFGLTEREDFGKVFNYLMENLSNVATDDIMSELSELAKVSYIAKEVNSKLDSLRAKNPEIITKFISTFKKQKIKLYSVLYEVNNGKIITKVTESNRNGAKDVIFNNWNTEFVSTGHKNGFLINKDNKDTVVKTKASKINNDFVNLRKLSGEEYINELYSLFNNIGIKVSKDALKAIKEDFKNKNNKKYFKQEFKGKALNQETFEGFINAYFGPMFNKFNNGENIFETNKGTIKSLAVYEQKFDVDASSQSFRSANGNMYYAYVNTHHLSNTIDKINSNDTDFFNEKLNNPFSSKSTWINNSDAVKLAYIDVSKSTQKGSTAKSYEDQNNFEKEVTKVSFFLNNGNVDRTMMLTVSPSDKTTFSLLDSQRTRVNNGSYLNEKLTLDSNLEKQLFDLFVTSEINRINQTVDDFNKTEDKNKLIEGYHYQGNRVGAGGYFFFIPELNEVLKRSSEGKIIMNESNLSKAKDIMLGFLESEIGSKIKQWENIGLQDFVDDEAFKQYDSKLSDLATNYVINNASSYANQFMMVTGDPALFAKIDGKFTGEYSNWKPVVEASLVNLFKRTSKDIAPGIKGKFDNPTYKTLFIEEPKENSLLGKEIKAYNNIKLADAQEWTTLEEHLNVMKAIGKIDQNDYDNIISNKDNLTYEQILTVIQPMKPVQVLSQMDNNFNAETQYYIKTSSFPLLSQLTKGFPELDKMRKFMEDNKIDRIAPKTAVKLGFHNAINLFNEDSFNDNNGFNGTVLTLNREGFSIQQDVPYDENKSEILEGSQMRKTIFADLTPDMEFSMGNAVELKKLSDAIHIEQYQRKLEELKTKLKVESDGIIQNMNELKDMMIKEGLDRGYSINDLLALTTKKLSNGRSVFNIPLFFHPMVHKIESLLNSIVKNKILKNKLPGKSFVQGSSLGFKVATEDFLKRVAGDNNGIILTKDYKGSLDYREENGELYAEIFLPSIFKDIDLTQYIGKDGLLDTNKIDPELLNMIGYRIPTQGFSSIIRLKVVGILPKVSGDLVIVPPAMVTQMGSDFDVDKLYVHNYNYYKDSNTDKIKKIKHKNTAESNLLQKMGNLSDLSMYSDEELQNHLLDIYHSILKNKQVQELSKNPLDNTEIDKLANGDLKQERDSKSLLSDNLHSDMVDVQAAGKLGIGITSLWVTGHRDNQYSGLYIEPKAVDGKLIYNAVMFDNKSDHEDLNESTNENNKIYNPKSNTVDPNITYGNHAFKGAFRLDKITGFDGRRISSVQVNIQTESVDNANKGNLYPMNLNKYTFDVAMLIADTGFNEKTIGYFLNQPIIKEYIDKLQSLNNFTDTEFIADKKNKLKEEVLNKLGIKISLDELTTSNINTEEMKSALNTTKTNTDLQKRVIQNFFVYEELADDIRKIRSALNVDTKFLGSNFSGVINRSANFSQKLDSKLIGNTQNLYNNTTSGVAHDIGVEETIKLFGSKNLLPYDSTSLKTIFNKISDITDRDLSDKDIENITIGIRSALVSEELRKIFNINDIYKYRKALLFGDNNIARRVIEAKESMPNNSFIQSLNPKDSYDSKVPATVEHYSAKDSKADYDYKKQMDWLKMLQSDDLKTRQLAKDLILYATTFGTERNARDFGRFIPFDFYMNSGLAKSLQDIDFNDESNASVQKLSSNFVQQYFQHYPNKLETLNDKTDSLYARKYNKDTKQIEVYKNINGKYVMLDRLGDDFLDEYDLDLSYNKTIMPNNPIGTRLESIRTVNPDAGIVKDIHAGEAILKDYGFDNGINSVLLKISESNSRFANLAKLLYDNSDKISDFTLERMNPDNPEHNVSNYYNLRGKVIDNAGTKLILVNQTNVDSDSRFQRTFMHETVHAFTLRLLKTNDSLLTKEQIEAKNNINKLYNDFLTKSKLDKRSFGNAEKDVYEFVSEVMVSDNLQKYLESKSYNNKSMMQKFIDLVKDLFGVKNDTMLEASIANIFQLAELQTEPMPKNIISDIKLEANETVDENNLQSQNKDITLSKTYKSVIDSWDIYGSKFEKAGYTQEAIGKMSEEELGQFIKDNIC